MRDRYVTTTTYTVGRATRSDGGNGYGLWATRTTRRDGVLTDRERCLLGIFPSAKEARAHQALLTGEVTP